MPDVCVYRRGDSGCDERIDKFVHAWYLVDVLLRNSIYLSVVDVKAYKTIFLRLENYWCCPLGLRRVDDSFKEQFVTFAFRKNA